MMMDEQQPILSQPSRRRSERAVGVALGMVFFWSAAVDVTPAAEPALAPGTPDRVSAGWKVFVQKRCIKCHAVWGLGGQIGPDLGRTKLQTLTASQLASAMWNHVPQMHSQIQRNNLAYPEVSLQEMKDLFSFLFFVQYLDEPGDPAIGQFVLHEKGCDRCHGKEGHLEANAPDLKRWADYANPIVWAQKMWEHAPKMEQAMRQANVTWPKLEGNDLTNIMAYVRSVNGTQNKTYLEPGSTEAGARLFTARGCQSCHRTGGVGADLVTIPLPRKLTALATRMWNHSPEMTKAMQTQGVKRAPLTAQEMADIIAYITSLRHDGHSGDAQRGRAIFQEKRCAQCHVEEQPAGSKIPGLTRLSTTVTPIHLAYAMWNHGGSMMDRILNAGFTWPVLQPNEVADLIAYLGALAPGEKTASVAPKPPQETRIVVPTVFGPPIKAGMSCVTNACHPGVLAERVVHSPVAQGDCASCHTMQNAQTHLFTLVSNGTSDLCYQCHDEPVETMRAYGPVSVGVCTACHDPHSAENAFGPGFAGNEVCFADMIGMSTALEAIVKPTHPLGRIPIPAPEAKTVTEPPATQQVAAATPVSPRTMPDLPGVSPLANTSIDLVRPPTTVQTGCVTSKCHPSIVSRPVLHGPTAQQQCLACHTLTDARNHRFQITKKEPDLCYECHDRPAEDAKFKHGPVGLGMCTPCHDPHGTSNKFMLPEAGADLCFICHTEMGSHVQGARVQHPVIQEKGCVACHDPHQSNVKFQLKKDVPDLCLECHDATGKVIAASTVAHQPVTADKKCSNCHNPHGSDVPKILNSPQMDLCLGCHDKPLDTPNGSIIDMKSWIENNPERHGPIRDGNCTGCHEPHGSKNFRILRHKFPKKFYSPFSLEAYALCFECHEESIVLDERTKTLTDFRNGDKNLHFLHVNQEKGRTCRACHEIHAGTKPKRIKDFVPFGKWKYPVNFVKTKTGGSCAPGCHVARAYDREQEVIQK